MNKAFNSKAVDLDSIPSRVKLKTLKIDFTAFLLVLHYWECLKSPSLKPPNLIGTFPWRAQYLCNLIANVV